ncbi:hypothetical protein BDZ90DRAFT_128129 [Jaminaea rosea]|uniref:Uncharacterized protein n=1 Tax=Jaminaea rosea TaxID=1569628 RepID=A0A316UTR8_9BASI|nr:hypothetical protein BDZ90DRAFT_128129 [Jaminaea rosea]PWN28690.1 hypothetical protein BDZ90DRAFT_128129 [Jaminaea rosea]
MSHLLQILEQDPHTSEEELFSHQTATQRTSPSSRQMRDPLAPPTSLKIACKRTAPLPDRHSTRKPFSKPAPSSSQSHKAPSTSQRALSSNNDANDSHGQPGSSNNNDNDANANSPPSPFSTALGDDCSATSKYLVPTTSKKTTVEWRGTAVNAASEHNNAGACQARPSSSHAVVEPITIMLTPRECVSKAWRTPTHNTSTSPQPSSLRYATTLALRRVEARRFKGAHPKAKS